MRCRDVAAESLAQRFDIVLVGWGGEISRRIDLHGMKPGSGDSICASTFSGPLPRHDHFALQAGDLLGPFARQPAPLGLGPPA